MIDGVLKAKRDNHPILSRIEALKPEHGKGR
jgi:hypothetical protein